MTAVLAPILVVILGLAIGAFTTSLIRGPHDVQAGDQPGIRNHTN